MEKKSKINIAQNTSSGAEKVEAIASENTEYSEAQTQPEKQVQQRKSKKVIKSKNGEKQSVQVKTKKEKAAAEARVQRAIKKKEEKENKKRLKAQKREEKRKKKEEMAKKRAEEKRIKEQKRIEEREARQREHARKKANAKRARQKQKERREQENKKRRSATAGNGGWIAAVVTLGVTTLALTTAVTVGAIEMMDSKQGMLSGYKSTTYELAGIMEHVNDDLDRARVANTPVQQSRILTDLLVQARLAEADLEKLPISPEEDSNVTSFLNRVAAESSRMLAKLQRGEKLSERDEQVLEKLYEINRGVKERLSSFTESMDDNMLMQYLKNKGGEAADMLKNLQELTLEENRGATEKMEGAGMRPQPKQEENSEGMGEENGYKPYQAEEACAEYFKSYKIAEFQCVGETKTQKYSAYNVQGYDENGNLLFAEVDSKNGALLRFNYYQECSDTTLSMENSQNVAQEFLSALGYDNMTVVRAFENGSDMQLTFVYSVDGVVYYPDTVKVKVCRERGLVSGMDASAFITHHTQRNAPEFSYSLEKAKAQLKEGLEVQSYRSAVVMTARGERTAYEFMGEYNGERYLIYIDAVNGNEIAIINMRKFS